MKNFLLAPLLLALSSPVLAAEKELTIKDMYSAGFHKGGLVSTCLAHSRGLISKNNANKMISLIQNDARKDLKSRGIWKHVKKDIEQTFSGSELKCKKFVYLLKD